MNETDLVAIECKSNLTVEDIKDHIQRLGKMKRLMPMYAQKRILGAVAAMVMTDNSAAQYAYSKGLFVIGQSGEQLTIRNAPDFQPAEW